MRWSDFAPPFVLGAFMAIQSYPTLPFGHGGSNANTIAIGAQSVIGTLILL